MNEHGRVQNTVDEPERTPTARRRFLLGLVAAGLAYVTPTLLGLDEAEAEPWKHSNRRRTRRTRPSNRRRTRRTRPSRRRPDRTRPSRRYPGHTRPSRRPGAPHPGRPEPREGYRTRRTRRDDYRTRRSRRDDYRTRRSRRDGRPGLNNGGFNGPGDVHRRADGLRRDI